MNNIHEEIKNIVEYELSCSAHNMDHIMRVYNLCMHIAKNEKNVELDILIPAVLIHDIARSKEDEDTSGVIDHAVLGSEMADKILRKLEFKNDDIENIKHCILSHRYRSGNEPKSIEAKILFDADKLDAIGAMGISRCFMLAGQYGERIYRDIGIEEYKKSNITKNGRIKDMSKHSPNIEYEIKLKKIKNRLFTETAKKLAENRMEYMGEFFTRLKNEVNGII